MYDLFYVKANKNMHSIFIQLEIILLLYRHLILNQSPGRLPVPFSTIIMDNMPKKKIISRAHQ